LSLYLLYEYLLSHSWAVGLESHYRQGMKGKTNTTRGNELGEEVACFLVRAHVHAGHSLSFKSAKGDMKILIDFIEKTPPISRDGGTPKILLEAVWKKKPYCIKRLTTEQPKNDKKTKSTAMITQHLEGFGMYCKHSTTLNEFDNGHQISQEKEAAHKKNLGELFAGVRGTLI